VITRRTALAAATLAPQALRAQAPRTRKLGYRESETILLRSG